MIDNFLNPFITFFQHTSQTLSGGDAMGKGLVTIWLITAAGVICRKVPSYLFEWIKRVCIISIRLESCGDVIEDRLYDHVLNKVCPISRTKNFFLRITNIKKSFKTTIQQDYGYSWFFYKGRFFWTNRIKNTQKAWGREESCVFYTFGTSAEVFNFLHQDFTVIDEPSYRKPNDTEWQYISTISGTTLLFLPENEVKVIDEKIDFFLNNKSWYIERNIPWKLVFLFHGEPGTGKTSYIQYIAQKIKYSIGNMDLTDVNKNHFLSLMINAGLDNVLVAIEDFDISKVGKARSAITMPPNDRREAANTENESDDSSSMRSLLGSVDLYDLLNVFQGTIPLHGNVVVLTTNDINGIDPALIRKGRMDLVLEIKRLEYTQIKAFFEYHYKGEVWPAGLLQDIKIKGCDLHGAFMDHPFEPAGFITKLKSL